MRKRCLFHKTHGERKSSSGLRFEELCTLRGRCSPDNCIFNDAGGKSDDQKADRKKTGKG